MYPGEGQERKGVGWQTGSEGLAPRVFLQKKRKGNPVWNQRKQSQVAENSARYAIRCGGGNLAELAERVAEWWGRAATTKAPRTEGASMNKTALAAPRGRGGCGKLVPREQSGGELAGPSSESSDSRIIKQWVGRSGLHWLSLTLSCALPCGPENNKEKQNKTQSELRHSES